MILNKFEINSRLNQDPPMVTDLIDKEIQLQPAGLDLTLKDIYTWQSTGILDFDNSKRKLSEKYKLPYDRKYSLLQGCYQIEVNERFNMPVDVAGITISRSSLQRCGAVIQTGYFDPGYSGIGVILLVVNNPHGLILHQDARICQMIFETTNPTEGYNGIYNHGC